MHADLLLTCAGTRPNGARVGALLSADDWRAFLALVEHHGMAPHVHDVLGSYDTPPSVMSSLLRLHDESSRYSLLLTARLLHLLDWFDAAQIPILTLKGPALGQQLYGDSGMRASVDLDLLVSPASVESAARVLQEHGYQLESPLSWLGLPDLIRRCRELTFRGHDGTGIDLHWASAPADYPSQIPDDRLWSSIEFVSIAGRPVPVLSHECLLVYLCVHGTRHCWTKLRWLCDVAMLVPQLPTPNSQLPTIDWDLVQTIAAESQATHALHLGLHLAHTLLKADLPVEALARVKADSAIVRAAADTTRRLRADVPQPQPSSLQRTIFNARLASTRRHGARHIAAMLKAPTEADALRLRLPRQLLFLYYPYRAARLAGKYSS